MGTNKVAEETVDVLGLQAAASPKDAEYDLVKSLLAAADFRNAADAITEVEIKRGGKYYFTVHLRPLGDDEVRQARKKATTYMKNPQGAKYPPIEKEFNANLFNSWMIYLSTVEADRETIWGNKAVKDKFGLVQNVETIDILLRAGEKASLMDTVAELSGIVDEEEEVAPEEFAKN